MLELELIFTNPIYRDLVRWFRQGNEITPAEALKAYGAPIPAP